MPQRSLVIFWLLLAATLSVDAVAIYWVTQSYSSHAVVNYDGLIQGQLSVICIWSALVTEKNLWTWLAPVLGVAVASLGIGLVGEPPLAVGLPYYGLGAVLLVASLWMFERTALWRRYSGASTEWRYSVTHLLIVTTVVAALAAAMRTSPHFGSNPWINLLYCCSYVAVAIASVVVWSLRRHWLIRLAGVLGIAMLLGGAFFWYVLGVIPLPLNLVEFIVAPPQLIQAIVLSAWLGLGPVLPISQSTAPGES